MYLSPRLAEHFQDEQSSISDISFRNDNDESARLERIENAPDESAVVGMIHDDFERLIEEDTYPVIIGAFLYVDKHYLMPIFKRPNHIMDS